MKPAQPAASNRPVAKLEQKLDDALGPPQAPAQPESGEPIRLDEPGHLPAAPGYTPDLVREAQYYVLEITNYGAELASILWPTFTNPTRMIPPSDCATASQRAR